MATRAALRATLPVAVVLALALFLVAATPSAAAAERDDDLRAGTRSLLGDPAPIVVDRKNVTKAELIALLDKGSAPALLAGDASAATVVAAGGSGRKLSQQNGYCRNSYYNCGRGCTLRCSGSRGLCYQNAWRCRGTVNLWYCPCGFYLNCYYTWSGVYATCLRA